MDGQKELDSPRTSDRILLNLFFVKDFFTMVLYIKKIVISEARSVLLRINRRITEYLPKINIIITRYFVIITLMLLFNFAAKTDALEVLGAPLLDQDNEAVASSDNSPVFKAVNQCDCISRNLKMMAQEAETDAGEQPADVSNDNIAEKVLKAGSLIYEDPAKAREIIKEAVRDCQEGRSNAARMFKMDESASGPAVDCRKVFRQGYLFQHDWYGTGSYPFK